MRRGLAGVELVTGDTKVVDKGKGDGVFINTAGIGVVEEGVDVSPRRVEPGDAIVISGDIGAHGVAILSVREGLEFESPIVSDTAPLWEPVRALLEAGVDMHCLRDLTRGRSRFGAERDRERRAAWECGSTKRRSRSKSRWPRRARSWGSTRSTWPMKGASPRGCRRATRTAWWTSWRGSR